MKLKRFFGSTLALALFSVVTLTALVFAQGTPFGNGRGAFRGDVYVPSTWHIFFGDNTSSDVSLAKNGANVVGINGNIGGSGSTANTTTSPAGPFAWGKVSLSGGTATVTFTNAFTNAPICMGTDGTGANAVEMVPTAVHVVITGTSTDSVSWACFGNPN